MTRNRKHDRPMRDPIDIWNDLLHDAAEQAAGDSTPTEDDRLWARQVEETVTTWMAGVRRRRTRLLVPIRRGVTIPPAIQAMDRGAILTQLERMRKEGTIQYANEMLRGLSEHDLQTLLTAALEPLAR
jgi:hypothetical protein